MKITLMSVFGFTDAVSFQLLLVLYHAQTLCTCERVRQVTQVQILGLASEFESIQ